MKTEYKGKESYSEKEVDWQMEYKTARMPREPEVRRQEILDTVMSIFMEEGYEATTMRDTTTATHVAPGLCHRYFESKQVLYDTAIEQYIKSITYPMIELLKETERSLDGFLDKMEQLFMQIDGKGKCHHFFHKRKNHDPQMLMSVKLCETIEPYIEEKLWVINEKGITRAKDMPITASYMLFGVTPVLKNDELSAAERASNIHMIMKCILNLQLS